MTRFVVTLRVRGLHLRPFLGYFSIGVISPTYARLKESTSYFGLNPRLCFNAGIASDALDQLTQEIRKSVFATSRKKDIGIFLSTFVNSRMLCHTILSCLRQMTGGYLESLW